METIVTEILEIIKGTKDNISQEEQLRSYFEILICRAVSEAFEELTKNWQSDTQPKAGTWNGLMHGACKQATERFKSVAGA